MHKNGFTMTELLVVLAIMAVLSIVAVPTFIDFLGHNKLKGASMVIVSAFQAARQHAITNRETCRVIVNYNQVTTIYHAVKIYQDSRGTLENWQELAAAVEIYSINLDTMSMPFPNDSDAVTSNHYYVEFYPDGHANANRTIGIREKVKQSNILVINVYNSTGDVRVR